MVPSGRSRARATRLPEAPHCRCRRPGGSTREPCNPAAGSGLLRPSPAPGLARQRGQDEEAVQSHAPAGQPDGGQVGHPLAAAGRCAPARQHSPGRAGDGARPASCLPFLSPRRRFPCAGWSPRGAARRRDPSSMNFPDLGAFLMLCLLLPGSGCQAQSVTHPSPASPAAPSPRPPCLSPGIPSPFASVASWKQVFAPIVPEAAEPQSLSEESSPSRSSGLLRGPGQVLGLVGLAELSLPPAVFVFWDCDCTGFCISFLAWSVKALGGGERTRRGGVGGGMGAGKEWRCCRLGPKTVFSGGRERLQKGRPNSSGR